MLAVELLASMRWMAEKNMIQLPPAGSAITDGDCTPPSQ